MRKITKLTIVLAVCSALVFLTVFSAKGVAELRFDMGCKQYLKRAADANTVEIAKGELAKAIAFAGANGLTDGTVSIFLHQPANDVGFWYQNLTEAYAELDSLSEDSTQLEQSNVLMKLRETLTDEGKNSAHVTVPSGIYIYPHNLGYFVWEIVALLAFFVFAPIAGVCLDEDKYF